MTYTPPEGVTIGPFAAHTLPASFRAPADAVISYKIYGTEAGVGTATAEGEPAGYKITLAVNDTPTPIYIGGTKLGAEEYADFSEQKVYRQITLSEPLRAIGEYKDVLDLSTGVITRYIKEIVLPDAKYQMTKNTASSDNYLYYFIVGGDNRIGNYEVICSHLPSTSTTPANNIGVCGGVTYNVIYLNLGADIMDAQSSGNTVSGLIEYATSEANNNTPIRIWYILETPITETVTVPAGLSGIVEGYLIQDGAPTPTSPIYPTVKDIVLAPTDPPLPLPSIITYDGENTISSTETLGDVEFTGEWTAIMGSTEDESIDIEFTVDAEEYIAFVTVDDESSIQVSDTITMPASASSFTLQVVSWGREQYTDTVYNALS